MTPTCCGPSRTHISATCRTRSSEANTDKNPELYHWLAVILSRFGKRILKIFYRGWMP
jgi:hypothetical protein